MNDCLPGFNRRVALRKVMSGVASVACSSVPVAGWSQQASGERWRLLVNEGITAELSISMLALRYRGWADYLGAQLRSKQVMVDAVVDIPNFVRQAQADPKPLVVFGKSVNQLAKLVRDGGYQPLVRRADPYSAAFIVGKNSPLQTMEQLSGKKILMPDEASATTALARAEISRLGLRETYLSYTRFQDAVTTQVAGGAAEVGVVNPVVAKKWLETGGRVIGQTLSVVNWSVLACPAASAEQVGRLTDALLAMNLQSPQLLAEIGVKQWARAERKDYLALLDYIKA